MKRRSNHNSGQDFWLIPMSAAIIGLLALSGCASVSVSHVRSQPLTEGPIPQRILVSDFETPADVFRVGRNGEALVRFRADVSAALTKELTRRISKNILPASPASRERPADLQNAWLIRGRFEKVDQGSRALRAIVGFWQGRTRMETAVEVYDLSSPSPLPILSFDTSGGSNFGPGAIVPTAVGIAASGGIVGGPELIRGVMDGLSKDRSRTARKITAVLSEYLRKRYGFETKRKLKAKPLGGIPSEDGLTFR